MTDPITRLNKALEGRYRVERQLGEVATVYLADDLRHERVCPVDLGAGSRRCCSQQQSFGATLFTNSTT